MKTGAGMCSQGFILICFSLKLFIAKSPHFPCVKRGATAQETLTQSVGPVPAASVTGDGLYYTQVPRGYWIGSPSDYARNHLLKPILSPEYTA